MITSGYEVTARPRACPAGLSGSKLAPCKKRSLLLPKVAERISGFLEHQGCSGFIGIVHGGSPVPPASSGGRSSGI